MPAQLDDLLGELAAHASSPWAIDSRRGSALASILSDVALGKDVSPARLGGLVPKPTKEGRGGDPLIIPGAQGQGDTAVVRVHGIATFSIDFQPFAYSSRALRSTMTELAADTRIRRIVMDFATPGGLVTGTPEAADAVFAARKKKPVVAAIDPLAASAGYYLASQASDIAIMPSGEAGSIGVYVLHMDMSRAFDSAGITPTYLYAGERKVDGNPLEPLSDRARTTIQGDIDTIYADFVAAVARGRGVGVSAVRNGFGLGDSLLAREAVRSKLADRIATLEQVLGGSTPSDGLKRPSLAGRGKADHYRRRLAIERLR